MMMASCFTSAVSLQSILAQFDVCLSHVPSSRHINVVGPEALNPSMHSRYIVVLSLYSVVACTFLRSTGRAG